MKVNVLWHLPTLCCLAVAMGCQNPRTAAGGASTHGHAGAADSQVQPAALSGEAPGSFPRKPPGRGLGRLLGGYGAGRRFRHGALKLSSADVQNLGIATAKAVYRPMSFLHSALGRISAPPPRMAKVSYPFPARISGIHVKLGDWVEKGQPVLTLQSEEVGRAKSEYYKATADLELARQNFEREQRLSARGVGAQKNALAAEAGFKVAQANLEAAEKKLHVLGFSEAEVRAIAENHQVHPEVRILAPIAGRVIEHKAILGAMVDQTTDLITLMDPTVLWVDAEVFERDIAKIRIGQSVQLSVPAYPGEIFRGTISYIGDTINPETRTLNVRTEVPNPHFKLKHGMFADVRIVLESSVRALTVPTEAVLEDNSQSIVFVKSNGEYAARVVTISAQQDGYCAVANGLREGEEVVVQNAYLLKSRLYDELLKQADVH